MYKSLHTVILTLYLQFYLMLNTTALQPDLIQLMANREGAQWPLQAGYPGLSVENLNEYVSLFSHCLVNIQNYQGIEIIGIRSPVYITRYDVFKLEICNRISSSNFFQATSRFLFGKFPPKFELNCTTPEIYNTFLNSDGASITPQNKGGYCRAQFDLFYPEPVDAPHIVYHSQIQIERSFSDIPFDYIVYRNTMKDAWSKIL